MTNPTGDDYEASQFFGCYFHQDHDLEYDSWEEAATDYATSGDAATLSATIRAIKAAIHRGNKDKAAARWLYNTCNCGWGPPSVGVIDWLKEVVVFLEQAR